LHSPRKPEPAPATDAAERRAWLRLSLSENVGPVTFRALIGRCGSAQAALKALPELSRKGGLRRQVRLYSESECEADLDRAAALGVVMLTAQDAAYPQLLRHVEDAPPVLWVKGNTDFCNREAVAVVGARNASALGLRFTRQVAAELAAAGLVVVSGMARGIDTAAHEATLATGSVAVLAGGADIVYPPENQKLHAALAERGLIVSEMKPGTVPKAEHFPRRNRIISGMARATLVMEAALRSGSLITARLAAEQGRDVFAVPGSPLDPRAEGTNRLIRNGATLLTSAADVLESLQQSFAPASARFLEPPPAISYDAEPDDGDRQRLIGLISPAPVDVDDLIRESRMPAALVFGILLELEIAGRVLRSSGGKVSLDIHQ
jgi:DNA processing protein